MERYDNLDLDCGASVTEKAAIFGGMLKRSSKHVVVPQDNLVHSKLSNSSDSLNDNHKEKGGVFKGILGKSPKSVKEGTPSQQASLSVHSSELSASSDGINENKTPFKEKTGVFGGILKRSPKPGHSRSESQDNFSLDVDLNGSSDSLSENNNNTKEKGSKFGAMFKMSNWTKGASSPSQDDLSVSSEKLGSSDHLSEGKDTKEKGGVFGGVFKNPKSLFTKSQSREDLTSDAELAVSSDVAMEKTGVLGGILKRTPKPAHRRRESQDDLLSGDMSASSDNLSEGKDGKEKEGFSGVFKKPKWTKSREDLTSDTELSTSSDNLPEKTSKEKGPDSDGEEEHADSHSGNKQNKLTGAMMKLNPFRSANKYDKHTDKHTGSDEEPLGDEKTSNNKQNAVAGAMAKMNPFRSANKKDTGQVETDKEVEKQGEEKSKRVKSSPKPQERMDRSGPLSVPVKPAKEDNENMALRQREKFADSPSAAARRTEEELSTTSRHVLQKPKNENKNQNSVQNQSDDEVLKEREEGRAIGEEEIKLLDTKAAKMKKPKRHNPFMPRVSDKAPSDDEGLNENKPLNTDEGNAEEEGTGQAVATKPKKTNKHNPFLPRVKVRPKKNPQDEPTAADDAAENEAGNRSLFDRLEDFRIDRNESEDQDVEGLMEWWSTVEQWEDMPQDDDMTEKEEAKAFALTAEKVQKGIRVFNKLFTERAESLWEHVIVLNSIADNLDRFNKKTKIAQITGGSTSAIGGVATIAGLALAPVTLGTSLIITAVGLGVATAGGLTSAGAGISNQVNNSLDRKKVEKIVEDYQEKMADINKCMTFIKQGIENLRKFDLLKMRKHAYNRDFPALNNIYEDGAMAGKAILINANEIMRVVQIANVAGSTAARAVQIASMATGVLTGLFVGMDIYFVAKDSKELKKGAKSEFAAKIREVAIQLHDGLVELNGIRDELQSTAGTDEAEASLDKNKKDEEKKLEEDSDEDEIDRIKKAIKKDLENREYV